MILKSQRKTQAERRGESERSLLEAAIDVIAEGGVGAVTFEALGRASGFSRGLASQRFGSKQNLIDALMNHLRERQETLHRERGFDELPGLDAVKSYADWCLRDLVEHRYVRAYFMLLSASIADVNAMRTAFQRVHAGVEEQLQGWLEKGQREGAVRADIDVSAAALMIGCLLFGFSMQYLVNPAMDFASSRKTCIAMLHNSLASLP